MMGCCSVGQLAKTRAAMMALPRVDWKARWLVVLKGVR